MILDDFSVMQTSECVLNATKMLQRHYAMESVVSSLYMFVHHCPKHHYVGMTNLWNAYYVALWYFPNVSGEQELIFPYTLTSNEGLMAVTLYSGNNYEWKYAGNVMGH